MRGVRGLILMFAILAGGAVAHAVQPDEILTDAGQESRARALSVGLRCLVCQNQSIDDSDAPLARDLRVLVRERIKAGDSDAAVIDYVVQRYGDFVLLKPPFKPVTLILWGTPLAVLLGGLWLAMRAGRGGVPARKADDTLTDAEKVKLDALLGKDS